MALALFSLWPFGTCVAHGYLKRFFVFLAHAFPIILERAGGDAFATIRPVLRETVESSPPWATSR